MLERTRDVATSLAHNIANPVDLADGPARTAKDQILRIKSGTIYAASALEYPVGRPQLPFDVELSRRLWSSAPEVGIQSALKEGYFICKA